MYIVHITLFNNIIHYRNHYVLKHIILVYINIKISYSNFFIHFSDMQTNRYIAFYGIRIIIFNFLISYMVSTISRTQSIFIEECCFSLWFALLCYLGFCNQHRGPQQEHTSPYSTLKTITTCVLGWSVSRLLLFPCNLSLAKCMNTIVGFNVRNSDFVVFMQPLQHS